MAGYSCSFVDEFGALIEERPLACWSQVEAIGQVVRWVPEVPRCHSATIREDGMVVAVCSPSGSPATPRITFAHDATSREIEASCVRRRLERARSNRVGAERATTADSPRQPLESAG